MSALNVGVVGVGRFGQHHARIYSEIPECRFVGVYDIDMARAEEIAFACGSKAFDSYSALLDEVDALSVVTPTATHREVALEPLKRGIHTLVEKPIALNTGEAQQLIDAAENSGAFLATGLLERFNPAFSAASELIRTPRHFNAERMGPWVGRRVTADVVTDLMIHDIDLLVRLADSEANSFSAHGFRLTSEFTDAAYALVGFASGLAASLVAHRAAERKERTIRLADQNRIIAIDMMRQELLMAEIDGMKADQELDWRAVECEKAEPLRAELRAFLAAASGGNAPICTGNEALRSLELALAISDRIRTGS